MTYANKVLLYSGGMDSIIADWLCKPDVCLYVDTGAGYSVNEISRLNDAGKPAHGRLEILSRHLQKLPQLTLDNSRDDKIVPQRNAFLILLAAQYGDNIMLGATAGDRSNDKDAAFASFMQMLLNHMWQPQHWLPGGRRLSVTLPLQQCAKGALVRLYLDKGGDPDRLVDSVSCYSPVLGKGCGQCKPCARKHVALTLNGIDSTRAFFPGAQPLDYFTKDDERMREIAAYCYRGKQEDSEILEVIRAAA